MLVTFKNCESSSCVYETSNDTQQSYLNLSCFQEEFLDLYRENTISTLSVAIRN